MKHGGHGEGGGRGKSGHLLGELCASGRPAIPILLVVAHPDDETIGVGGRLAAWAPDLTIVHVTNGAPADGVDARAAGVETPAEYAAARRRELEQACALLPHAPARMMSMGVTDREVVARVDDVFAAIRSLIADLRPAVVVTHAYEGGHPDHDAIAMILQSIAAKEGNAPFQLVEFAGYHEGPDGRLVTNRFVASGIADGRVRVPLEAAEAHRKRQMLDRFVSQRRVLASFDSGEEWLRPARRDDFAVPPPGGRIWYERLPWGAAAPAWRAAIAAAVRRLAT